MPSSRNRELKLFYWDELESGGCALALAATKDKAIELVVEDARDIEGVLDGQLETLRAELTAKRAHIHYKPVGFLRAP